MATAFSSEEAKRKSIIFAELGFVAVYERDSRVDHIIIARARKQNAEFKYVLGASGGLFAAKNNGALKIYVGKDYDVSEKIKELTESFPDFYFKAQALTQQI